MSHEAPLPSVSTTYRNAFYIALAVVALFISMMTMPIDDGLRHVGLAFAEHARSWGDVYPLSTFAAVADYDPWGGYDWSLRMAAGALELLGLPRLTLQFLLVKLLVFAFSSTFLWLCVQRSRIGEELRAPRDIVPALFLVSAMLAVPLLRVETARPFAFGGLLLLYSVGQTGFVRGLLASGVTCFMYPYLAWMYTGPVCVAHFVKGDRRFSYGAAFASAVWCALQPRSFWQLLAEVVHSDSVRASLDPKITEFAPLHESPVLIATLLALAFFIAPKLSAHARKLRVEHVLALLFVPVSIKYVRYMVDVQLPLLFVAYAPELLRLSRKPLARALIGWRRLLGSRLQSAKQAPVTAAVQARRRVVTPLRIALALGYSAVLVMLFARSAEDHAQLAVNVERLAHVPRGARVLTGFNSQYQLLYARPDLSVVPSCEIGFASPEILAPYLAYFNQGRVCELALAVHAEFFVENRATYIDPVDSVCLKLEREDKTLRVWHVQPTRSDAAVAQGAL